MLKREERRLPSEGLIKVVSCLCGVWNGRKGKGEKIASATTKSSAEKIKKDPSHGLALSFGIYELSTGGATAWRQSKEARWGSGQPIRRRLLVSDASLARATTKLSRKEPFKPPRGDQAQKAV